VVQTLSQGRDYAITVLAFDPDDIEENEKNL
jgi:hypothetical protein